MPKFRPGDKVERIIIRHPIDAGHKVGSVWKVKNQFGNLVYFEERYRHFEDVYLSKYYRKVEVEPYKNTELENLFV